LTKGTPVNDQGSGGRMNTGTRPNANQLAPVGWLMNVMKQRKRQREFMTNLVRSQTVNPALL
jgi:hypothetical protein